MPADRRLFDSSSLVTPPAPAIDAVTCNVETPEVFEPPSIEELLKDSTFVHLNMLRGGIAMPTDAQVKHLYPHLFGTTLPESAR